MREVAWVVFDEIHYMRDKGRIAKHNDCIAYSLPHLQMSSTRGKTVHIVWPNTTFGPVQHLGQIQHLGCFVMFSCHV